jgi:hypothetical protein
MQLLKNVLFDIIKEVKWVIIYSIITTIVIMAFILISSSYITVRTKSTAISNFVSNNITMAKIRSVGINNTSRIESERINFNRVESLDNYYKDVFAEGGKAGTYIVMSGRNGYQQVILLLGAYANLTPFELDQVGSVTFAISNDQKEYSDSKITVNGNDYPLYIAPEGMSIYHPLNFLPPESDLLHSTLFVFSQDYEAIQKIFSKSEYPELESSVFLERLVFEDPKNQDLVRLRNVVFGNTGDYVSFQSTKDYISSVSSSGTRTHQTYLLFYVSASLTFIGSMLINIYSILKRRIPDYITHHLFGASKTHIYVRMFVFAWAYHIIPVVESFLMLSLNRMLSPRNTFLILVLVFGSIFLITELAFNKFQFMLEQGLRGD